MSGGSSPSGFLLESDVMGRTVTAAGLLVCAAILISASPWIAREWGILWSIPGICTLLLFKLAASMLVDRSRPDRNATMGFSAFAAAFATLMLLTLAGLYVTFVPRIVANVERLGELAGGSLPEALVAPGESVVLLCTVAATGLLIKEPWLQRKRREGLGLTINLAACLVLAFTYFRFVRAALSPLQAILREIQ